MIELFRDLMREEFYLREALSSTNRVWKTKSSVKISMPAKVSIDFGGLLRHAGWRFKLRRQVAYQ